MTAYSEFFVQAVRDPGFKKILQQADLVVPDGVGPLAAIEYVRRLARPHPNPLLKGEGSPSPLRRRIQDEVLAVFTGLQSGWQVITGRVGEPVTGVWLTQKILELAPRKKWKVFLLGGYGDTAHKLKSKYQKSNINKKSEVRCQMSDVFVQAHPGVQDLQIATEADHHKTINIINKFQPDILLVAYGPIQQEKWIAKYKSQLQTSVIIGVGGSFDELTGRVPSAPTFLQHHGLKWLWRLLTQPRRITRIWKAVVVFPWLVWKYV